MNQNQIMKKESAAQLFGRLVYMACMACVLCWTVSCSRSSDEIAPVPPVGTGTIRLNIRIAPSQTSLQKSSARVQTRNINGQGFGQMALLPPKSDSDFTGTFSTGDEIGLFIVPAGQALSSGAPVKNARFVYDGTDWTGAADWPSAGANFDVYAYYPYDAAMTAGSELDFAVQQDQSTWAGYQRSDLMTAVATNVSSAEAVPLTFAHRMSLVQVEVNPADVTRGNPQEQMQVSLRGVQTSTMLSFTDPSVQAATPTLSDIAMYRVEPATDKTKFTYRALVPSQNIAADKPLLMLHRGDEQHLRSNGNSTLRFSAGEANRIRVQGLWQSVWIPAGTFQMGSPDSDPLARPNEKPQHWVKLSKGFYMSQYEVTIGEYAAYLNAIGVEEQQGFVYVPYNGERISAFLSAPLNQSYTVPHFADGEWKALPGQENYPMVDVYPPGARAYAQWAGGELPTEAQWEYAARAGTQTRWFFGSDDTDLSQYAWGAQNGQNLPSQVGTLKPNPWGLYDIYGNVSEFCLPYGQNYPSGADSPQTAIVDPVDLALQKASVRGGSFLSTTRSMMNSVSREFYPNSAASQATGFRIIKYP